MSSPIPALSAPFVVSVTGHKDIDDTEVLKTAFAKKLAKLKSDAQQEAHDADVEITEWVLLSALAEGADTLAADVAAANGWKVIAPLPLPRKDYERDFKGAALDKFNKLLDEDKCPYFFIGYAPDCTPENTRFKGDGTDGNNEFRNRQYAYLGEFLTRHCEVLIAFWDGNDAAGIGGTGYVVNLQREGLAGYSIDLRHDGTLLDAPETGRTFAIWSKRKPNKERKAPFDKIVVGKTHGNCEPIPHGLIDLKEEAQPAKPVKLTARQMERACEAKEKQEKREAKRERERREKRRKEWSEFVDEANKIEFTGKAEPQELNKYQPLPLGLAWKEEYLAHARDAFLRADKLAKHFQAKTKRAFYLATAIVLTFTLCVAGADAYAESRWNGAILVASWVLLAGAFGSSRWQTKSGDANRHQDYRALAEAWRVAFFWRALGIQTPLDTCYLRSQRGELDWIRAALRTADLQWRAKQRESEPDEKGELRQCGYPKPQAGDFETVFKAWIEDQTKYFKKNVPKSRVELTSLRHWSRALLVLGLGANAFESLVRITDANVIGAAWLSEFLRGFASADLLASPFVPALLLVLRMNSWPIATDENTKFVRDATAEQTDKRRKLREQFVQRNAAWTFVAVISGLLALGAAGAIHVGIIPTAVSSAGHVPFLQMLETLCFFLPSLIYVAAEHNALPEQVKNYERMSAIFARAEKMLGQLTESAKQNDESDATEVEDKARRIYAELGREALHENGEWLIIHRDRPLDVEI